VSGGVQGGFARTWRAEILKERPLILPRLRFVYPREAEEVERGALEVLVQPEGGEAFLATCALGFADPVAPTGVWSCPDPGWVCAVAGGYAYLIDTGRPERFEQVGYRPVLGVHAVEERRLLLFVGNQAIVAYGERGMAWESQRLSDEGISIHALDSSYLFGAGWELATDCERAFRLRLQDGTCVPAEQSGE
jgi:hypothetical protein